MSMAIYGEVVTDATASVTPYTPGLLQLPDPVSISPALDLANASDPTCLARQLLALIPDPPSLNLVIRLMFCLKPPNDDWDLPEFPHLYSDLNEEDMDIDLDSAFRCLSRPVAEDASVESLQRFAEKIADAIGPMVCSKSVRRIIFQADDFTVSRTILRLISCPEYYAALLHKTPTLHKHSWCVAHTNLYLFTNPRSSNRSTWKTCLTFLIWMTMSRYIHCWMHQLTLTFQNCSTSSGLKIYSDLWNHRPQSDGKLRKALND